MSLRGTASGEVEIYFKAWPSEQRIDVCVGNNLKHRITHSWDAEDSRCRLLLDDSEKDLWRISETILSPFAFGD